MTADYRSRDWRLSPQDLHLFAMAIITVAIWSPGCARRHSRFICDKYSAFCQDQRGRQRFVGRKSEEDVKVWTRLLNKRHSRAPKSNTFKSYFCIKCFTSSNRDSYGISEIVCWFGTDKCGTKIKKNSRHWESDTQPFPLVIFFVNLSLILEF